MQVQLRNDRDYMWFAVKRCQARLMIRRSACAGQPQGNNRGGRTLQQPAPCALPHQRARALGTARSARRVQRGARRDGSGAAAAHPHALNEVRLRAERHIRGAECGRGHRAGAQAGNACWLSRVALQRVAVAARAALGALLRRQRLQEPGQPRSHLRTGI